MDIENYIYFFPIPYKGTCHLSDTEISIPIMRTLIPDSIIAGRNNIHVHAHIYNVLHQSNAYRVHV